YPTLPDSLFTAPRANRGLHSFPTRRSSDLDPTVDAAASGAPGVLLDADPLPAPGLPLETRLIGADGAEIPAYLLRPAPEVDLGAGVVLVAGHGNGIDDLVDPADEYHHGLAQQMASIGFTVLCPEMVSFGRRRLTRPEGAEPYGPGENSCGIDAARYLLHVVPVMGRRVADAAADVRAVGSDRKSTRLHSSYVLYSYSV